MNIEINAEGLETGIVQSMERPGFTEIEPDFTTPEKEFDTLVVIGNGGSVTSLRALYYAFLEETEAHLEIVTTMDPDRLHQLEKRLDPENTLVMPISKSGETVGVIESLMYFINRGYEFMALTTDNSPLYRIARKTGAEVIKHQEVGGRFSGLTNTALTPLSMLGLETEHIRKGGEKVYRNMRREAAETASLLQSAEEKGLDEVLAAFYGSRLYGFKPLLIQLMHETVCKNGEGQTFLGDHAPEYQHHTNQRLFGGKKNMLPLFFKTGHRQEKINLPEKYSGIESRGEKLERLDGENLSDALNSELKGVKEALREEDRSFIELELKETSYEGFGSLMAFLQLVAYYSADIRGVNPLTQPDVEKSKQKGFEARFS